MMGSFKTFALLGLISAQLTIAPPIHAQDREAVKADGKAFANEQKSRTQQNASTTPDASRIPNFANNPSQSRYADDPDAIEGDARAAARSHEGLKAIKDSSARRAKFSAEDIRNATSRAKEINEKPLDYTSGMEIGGSQGRCVALPCLAALPWFTGPLYRDLQQRRRARRNQRQLHSMQWMTRADNLILIH